MVSTRLRFAGAYVPRGLAEGIFVGPEALFACSGGESLGTCCCVHSGESRSPDSGCGCDFLAGLEVFCTSHVLPFGNSPKYTESNDFVGMTPLTGAKVLTT